jgi:hypothetical protein
MYVWACDLCEHPVGVCVWITGRETERSGSGKIPTPHNVRFFLLPAAQIGFPHDFFAAMALSEWVRKNTFICSENRLTLEGNNHTA